MLTSETVEGIAKNALKRDESGMWGSPIAGFADAESDLFAELKSTAYSGHRLPSDYLEGAKTVVCCFLPFERKLAEGNCFGKTPSDAWVDAYDETNLVADEICARIGAFIESEGFRWAAPSDAREIVDGTYSRWSHRHAAYIAGMGTFGMNNMLITDKGSCGRFLSVITDMPARCGSPLRKERCLHKAEGGCGLCMNRCFVNALKPSGFDRTACLNVCLRNMDDHGADVCGKCTVAMPCSHGNPTARPPCTLTRPFFE